MRLASLFALSGVIMLARATGVPVDVGALDESPVSGGDVRHFFIGGNLVVQKGRRELEKPLIRTRNLENFLAWSTSG